MGTRTRKRSQSASVPWIRRWEGGHESAPVRVQPGLNVRAFTMRAVVCSAACQLNSLPPAPSRVTACVYFEHLHSSRILAQYKTHCETMLVEHMVTCRASLAHLLSLYSCSVCALAAGSAAVSLPVSIVPQHTPLHVCLVCVPCAQARSKQMNQILDRLKAYGEFEIIIFGACVVGPALVFITYQCQPVTR